MSLNLLEPFLADSLEESAQDEVLHFVCMPCNGGVALPLMECLCGHWDEDMKGPGGHAGMPYCPKCAILKKRYKCPRGHVISPY